jgi:hypothetical protein
MFNDFTPDPTGAQSPNGPTQPPGSGNIGGSAPNHGTARHILFGTRDVLRLSIANLHKRGYAEPNDWSKPLPTGRPEEFMSILTKQVPLN